VTPSQRTVLVLGAGFTKAFYPETPLLTGDYYEGLAEKLGYFPRARRLLELEQNYHADGRINIERLMTRFDSRMPYDMRHGTHGEFGLVLSEVKSWFTDRLRKAMDGQCYAKELQTFANYCMENHIDCITFNYDDFFDQALWQVSWDAGKHHRWNPDGGYGFLCSQPEIGTSYQINPWNCSMLLLKLHGSVNWRIKLGYTQPYPIEAISHFESWTPIADSKRSRFRPVPESELIIEDHYEPEPFIIPPVLAKAALVEQPVLRIIWARAYQQLSKAERIFFIGYSLPVTDIAASLLFGEALQHLTPSQIKVVNLCQDEKVQRDLQLAYRKIFPGLAEQQFDFREAREWAGAQVLT
jgi:hypothetical protein